MFLIFTEISSAEEILRLPASAAPLPKYEFGVGFGTVHFEQYPSSDQSSNITLPFPTFQYRGSILRADDKEGAKIYLARGENWIVDLSGTGFPALESNKNEARSGMPDLPWMGALGPQADYHIGPDFHFKVGVYQTLTTNFQSLQARGAIIDVKLNYTYSWTDTCETSLSTVLRSATKEYHELYFGVPGEFATTSRPKYEPQAGFVSANFSIFQSLQKGPVGYYLGLGVTDYTSSINRASPLQKNDRNVNFLIGVTYDLYRSETLASSNY